MLPLRYRRDGCFAQEALLGETWGPRVVLDFLLQQRPFYLALVHRLVGILLQVGIRLQVGTLLQAVDHPRRLDLEVVGVFLLD